MGTSIKKPDKKSTSYNDYTQMQNKLKTPTTGKNKKIIKQHQNKKTNKQKTEYINKKLDKSSDQWKTLIEIINTKSFTSPRSITNKDEITTNIKEICNIDNNFYINSIKKLRENIPKIMTSPVEILKIY